MTPDIKTFADPATLAAAFATDFARWVESQTQDKVTVALSGGSTPKLLFELWGREYTDKIDWSRIDFFWGDERCVPPTDNDSNFGVAKALFIDKVSIADSHIHRIYGESNPDQERKRYEQEICSFVETDNQGMPLFDLIILGMGDDGHTASIFPYQSQFLQSNRTCEVATHPQTGQKRITLTGPVLNQAKKTAFLITGASKADVLKQVIHKTGNYEQYPASYIDSDGLCFYLDAAAAMQL